MHVSQALDRLLESRSTALAYQTQPAFPKDLTHPDFFSCFGDNSSTMLLGSFQARVTYLIEVRQKKQNLFLQQKTLFLFTFLQESRRPKKRKEKKEKKVRKRGMRGKKQKLTLCDCLLRPILAFRCESLWMCRRAFCRLW